MIDARHLSKTSGTPKAVDDLSFTVQPGQVTGFLGPNGAGKSTTIRMIMGLDAPTSGAVTVGGLPYRDLPMPLQVVGALLEARAIHTSRPTYIHLLALATTHGIPNRGHAESSTSWRKRDASTMARKHDTDELRRQAADLSVGCCRPHAHRPRHCCPHRRPGDPRASTTIAAASATCSGEPAR